MSIGTTLAALWTSSRIKKPILHVDKNIHTTNPSPRQLPQHAVFFDALEVC